MTAQAAAIVVTYFTGPALKDCLYILQSEPHVGEIIIVNNGNTPSTQDWMATYVATHPCARLITGHGNIGFGAAVNLGATQTHLPYILVINPDALLVRGSVQELIKTAESRPDAGLIGGHLFDINGTPSRGPRRTAPRWRDILGFRKWNFHDTPLPKVAVDMPVISGALFLTARSVFRTLNGFDEVYFLHFEDIDICVRAEKAGFRNAFCPHACALHYGSTSEADPKIIKHFKAQSLGIYLRKNAHSRLDRLLNFLFLKPLQLILRNF